MRPPCLISRILLACSGMKWIRFAVQLFFQAWQGSNINVSHTFFCYKMSLRSITRERWEGHLPQVPAMKGSWDPPLPFPLWQGKLCAEQCLAIEARQCSATPSSIFVGHGVSKAAFARAGIVLLSVHMYGVAEVNRVPESALRKTNHCKADTDEQLGHIRLPFPLPMLLHPLFIDCGWYTLTTTPLLWLLSKLTHNCHLYFFLACPLLLHYI